MLRSRGGDSPYVRCATSHAWQSLNTFRTNAQIEAGRICEPEIT